MDVKITKSNNPNLKIHFIEVRRKGNWYWITIDTNIKYPEYLLSTKYVNKEKYEVINFLSNGGIVEISFKMDNDIYMLSEVVDCRYVVNLILIPLDDVDDSPHRWEKIY